MTGVARVDFYHLQKFRLEEALPRLLERVLKAGQKALVVAASEDRVEDLNGVLWAERDAWIPHGSRRDGHATLQPIWLTDDPLDNANAAEVLVLSDGMDSPLVATLPRTLDLFDGRDEAAVLAARQRWSARRAAGHVLYYWQQNDDGRWVERARQGGDKPSEDPAGGSGDAQP